jgi:hypothetical protein
MQGRIVRNLIYAQVSFFLCLIVDVFITTKAFYDNRGLSFFGEHINTAIPFAIGFILCDFFLLRAARLLPEASANFTSFTAPLKILAVLLISIVLTPDTLNGLFNILHDIASSSLFLFELLLSIWLAIRWYNTFFTWFLVTSLFLVGIATGLSELGVAGLLGVGSLVYQLIFSILLVFVMFNVVGQHEAETVPANFE